MTVRQRNSKKKRRMGRPKTSTREITRTTQDGCKEGWDRATFIIREEYKERLRALACWEGKEIKEVVDEALTEYLREKKVKPIPRKEK